MSKTVRDLNWTAKVSLKDHIKEFLSTLKKNRKIVMICKTERLIIKGSPSYFTILQFIHEMF